jgi:cellulose synthase (UDP-forming)
MQAGCYGDWAPMCIGSQFASRTSALKEIGGLGPELSEDHSTTFLFNAHGWKGVHAIDAICDGRGPESFKDGIIQELQWARSIIILFLTLTPKHLHKFSWKLKFQFLFSQLWYFIYVLSTTLMLTISPLALITGQPLMNMNYWYFLVASTVPVAFSVAILYWLKRQKLLRPVNTKIINWEVGLFTLARYPIILWAHIDAIKMTYFKNRRVWKVTPKKKEDNDNIPLKLWLPLAIIPALILAVQWAFPPNSHTFFYYIFNYFNIATYLGALTIFQVVNRIEMQKVKARKQLN